MSAFLPSETQSIFKDPQSSLLSIKTMMKAITVYSAWSLFCLAIEARNVVGLSDNHHGSSVIQMQARGMSIEPPMGANLYLKGSDQSYLSIATVTDFNGNFVATDLAYTLNGTFRSSNTISELTGHTLYEFIPNNTHDRYQERLVITMQDASGELSGSPAYLSLGTQTGVGAPVEIGSTDSHLLFSSGSVFSYNQFDGSMQIVLQDHQSNEFSPSICLTNRGASPRIVLLTNTQRPPLYVSCTVTYELTTISP